jgi:hypothetical protein
MTDRSSGSSATTTSCAATLDANYRSTPPYLPPFDSFGTRHFPSSPISSHKRGTSFSSLNQSNPPKSAPPYCLLARSNTSTRAKQNVSATATCPLGPQRMHCFHIKLTTSSVRSWHMKTSHLRNIRSVIPTSKCLYNYPIA